TAGLPCRTTDPELWFSRTSADRTRAVALCRECPIQTACAQYALDNRDVRGVWGGTTLAERRSFHDGRPWRFDDEGRLRLECGSEDAYRAHFGYREQPCADCVAAHEAHVEADRRARLAVEHEAGGSSVGFWLHRRLSEPPCAGCRAQQAERWRAAARRREAARGRRQPRRAGGTSGAAEALPGAPAATQPFALAG
ncbi:MAG: WhiB family transcriptional regulator, partial [Streptomyces sp.]|nr:WhiB family transcriptional regulator [Streptomyces sp.]